MGEELYTKSLNAMEISSIKNSNNLMESGVLFKIEKLTRFIVACRKSECVGLFLFKCAI